MGQPEACAHMKPIPGFAGYVASEDGLIISIRSGEPKPLLSRLRKGYLVVTVSVEGQRRRYDVHRLVLSAFKGLPPFEGAVCRHLNGLPADNRPCNLEWGTCKQNYADSVRHGTHGHGMRAPRRKLDESQVIEIRARSSRGESNAALAREFNICASYVPRLVRGQHWPHA